MYWKQWLKSLLSLVILLGVLEVLLPSGGLAKFSKLVLGLALMLAILQPLTLLLNQDVAHLDLSWFLQNGGSDVAVSANRVRWAAVKPFFEQDREDLTNQLEDVLLGLADVQETKIYFHSQSSSGGIIEVYLKPFNTPTKLQVEQIISTMLNLPVSQIKVQAWVD